MALKRLPIPTFEKCCISQTSHQFSISSSHLLSWVGFKKNEQKLERTREPLTRRYIPRTNNMRNIDFTCIVSHLQLLNLPGRTFKACLIQITIVIITSPFMCPCPCEYVPLCSISLCSSFTGKKSYESFPTRVNMNEHFLTLNLLTFTFGCCRSPGLVRVTSNDRWAPQ